MKTLSILGVLGALAISFSLQAGELSKADTKAVATIRQNIEQRYPQVIIVSVQPSKQLPGLYEVFTGDTLSYSNATGDLVLVGQLIETQSQKNMTVARLDELTTIDFSKLPLDRAIKTVKGNGSRQIAVFADPECPYCQQLEKEFATLNDVTIYTFLYPIASLHPDAPARAHALWCTEDRSAAWNDWMVNRKAPAAKTCEGDPIDELQKLGEKLFINSTPTLFSSSGKRFAGMMPAPKLDQFIDGKTADPKTARN